MTSRTLTPEGKALLSSTIRALRQRLLRDLGDEAERRYRFSVAVDKAGLDEAHRRRRQRLEAWLDERVRSGGTAATKTEKDRVAARGRFFQQAIKEAAATLLNRLVLLRHLEALGLSRPAIVTGGWNSRGYQELRDFAPALTGDETEGYATLLQLVFDDLAIELPGLFGDVGLTRLFYVPPATLREIVSRLDDEGLASAWTDDTTLGWVYQYWNDPEREALDAKIADGGKIQPHEIASKTQMFTERYMVEWLLQNSLGLTWLCICRRNGWTADAQRVLPVLEARRVGWRARREAGEVALDALMPIEGDLEGAWKYYVPQPLPQDLADPGAVQPRSIRDVRLLDPACGSGHFLTAAFDLLAHLYHEEARHRGETWSDAEIAESILTRNLHGVDIDARAVQIAAAGLYLKAKTLAPNGRLSHVNLVAPTLQLGNLPDDDPALVQLRRELKDEAGIPEELTRRLMSSLAGVDYLGTLLKVDSAVEEALYAADLEFERGHGQGDLFAGYQRQQVKLSALEAKTTVLSKLEQFLARHSGSDDLGLRLDGEQLAAGVRFVRIVRDGTYDVVVGNPPYHTTAKLAVSKPFVDCCPEGRADLFASFYVRAMELTKPSGRCGYVTLSNWMFLGGFETLRRRMIDDGIALIADFGKGAFSEGSQLITTAACVLARGTTDTSRAFRLFDKAGAIEDRQPQRVSSSLLAQVGQHDFDPKGFAAIAGTPVVYWWSKDFLSRYVLAPKLGETYPIRYGLSTQNNTRWIRKVWEIRRVDVMLKEFSEPRGWTGEPWVPYIKGAEGRNWFDMVSDVVLWRHVGLELGVYPDNRYGRGTGYYFVQGVAFVNIGTSFSARVHRRQSIFGHVAGSVFGMSVPHAVCLLNTTRSRWIMEALNPGVHFLTADVERLPLLTVPGAEAIYATLESSFSGHEIGREASVEFRKPERSSWRYGQEWAQFAVDRLDGEPLSAFEPQYDPPDRAAFVSFMVGVALGRFGAAGEGVLDTPPPTALPAGIIFLVDDDDANDSFNHPACAPLHAAWTEHGAAVGEGDDLRTYLRTSFFDWHKRLYENRPIYFPLTSAKKSYVAFISIHRWRDDTLQVLLVDHLLPEKRRLDGEMDVIRNARAQATGRGKAEKRFAELGKLIEELSDFIEKVTAIATFGPPPPDDKTPRREVDAPFVMDLDDGVMVNSAALWPLLEPQWKDPKKWWRELATAQGRKDYDWAHLSARYFPTRVREKCVKDPSLAVAHKCFWALHPAKAYAWELRLQDEIRPDFTIDEPGSNDARARFLSDHPTDARDLLAKETQRRARKAAKAGDEDESTTPLLDRGTSDDTEEANA